MAAAVKCSLGNAEEDKGLAVLCGGAVHNRSDFSEEELRLLRIRSESKVYKKEICDVHRKKYLTNFAHNQKKCCDPLKDHGEESKVKGKSVITVQMREKCKDIGYLLTPGKKLCINCSSTLYAKLKDKDISLTGLVTTSPSVESSQTTTGGSQQDKGDLEFQISLTPSCLEYINKFFEENNEESIDLQKIKTQTGYMVLQLEKLLRILSKCANLPAPICDIAKWETQSGLFEEFITQLKTYVASSPSTSQLVLAISVLPRSMPASQIHHALGPSKRFVKKVKTLVDVKGILCTPDKVEGRKLSADTVKAVKDFYYMQDVSKELTGKNNTVSVKENGARVHKPKRLLMGNIMGFHEEFLEKFPNIKISASKFAALRPKECVLASASGMHNVCVCTYHENPRLMFSASGLKDFTNLTSVTDCLQYLMCSKPTPECHLRTCAKCPDWTHLRSFLETAFDTEMIENVTYNQWDTADRGDLSTFSKSIEDFNDLFLAQLEELATHHFIFKQQSSYFSQLKEQLKIGEVLIVGDFAENYSFVVQDSIQALYFRQKQATIHPFSVYYRDPVSQKIMQLSYASISDYMNHSTVAFYAFQKRLLVAIQTVIPFKIEKVLYFSDGCGGQYKNRCSAANVFFHEKDFGSKAEWHFFATSHGRSACDGIGGTIKKLAALYSKQHTEVGAHITTPRRLFEWAEEHITGIRFMWVSKENVETEEKFLQMRFSAAYAVEGIKSSHCIIPCENKNKVIIKKYSAAQTGEEKDICVAEGTGVQWSDVKGFVSFFVTYNMPWELGYVEEKFEQDLTIKVSKLNLKSGKKYDYEFSDVSVLVNSHQILSVIEPRISSKGQNVKVMAAEAKIADAKLKIVLSK